MAFDQAGFNQELKELAEKYGMMQNMRFVHRFECDIRKNRPHCTCLGRHEYVLYSRESEEQWKASQAMQKIGERR